MLECERAELYIYHSPVAIKTHICCECQTHILPKEQYHLHKTFFDGEWNRYKRCNDCETLINNTRKKLSFNEIIPFGCYLEWLQEDINCNNDEYLTFLSILRKRNSSSYEVLANDFINRFHKYRGNV